MGEGNFDRFRAHRTVSLNGFLCAFLHAFRQAVKLVILFRKTDFQAFDRCFCKTFGKSSARIFKTCAVRGIVSADRIEHDRRIAHGLGDRSDLIQRRSERNESEAGNSAVSGLESDHAAERRGLTDGAACIGCERRGDFISCDCCGGTAARSARNAIGIARIACLLIGGIFAGRAHGEFIHIGPSERDESIGTQFSDCSGIVNSLEILQNFGGAGTAFLLDGYAVFDSDRDAVIGAQRAVFRTAAVGFLRGFQDMFLIDFEESLNDGIDFADLFQRCFAEFNGTDLAGSQFFRAFRNIQFGQIAHDIPSPGRTCGILTSSPLITAGALASIVSRA